ncbi:MAG: cysteine desulfurase [Rhodopirellula sp. TMED11]|nr:MAG: cysteine desulfurase [Rhodopirellula sp. TMED11]
MPLDPQSIRQDFPILKRRLPGDQPLVFLDNAASSQRPQAVIDAMTDCYENFYANVHRGIHTLSEESTAGYEAARVTTQQFLNAASQREVIFTSGTTAAINLVARSWGDAHVTADDTILLTICEHHANIVPWHQLAERVGCRVEFLLINDDYSIDTETVAEALQRLQPKLFAFTATSNVLGTVFPVQQWAQLAKDNGATVLVDAAQAAPHQAIDVQDWDADFVIFSGHKVCGPSGIGVLYGREALLAAMPPFLGGGAMIDRVTVDGFTSAELPEKFEAGTPPIVEAIGLGRALQYLQDTGLNEIARHERDLAAAAEQQLRDVEGVNLFGPRQSEKAGIVSFTIDGVHPHDIAQWLNLRGIAVRAGHHCAMPLHEHMGLTATARASFYLYNTHDEVEQLVDAVKQTREKFARSGRRRRRSSISSSSS